MEEKCAKNIINAQAAKIINKRKSVWKTGPIINFKWRVFKKKIKYETQYFTLKIICPKILKLVIKKMESAESDNKINTIMEDVLIHFKKETF